MTESGTLEYSRRPRMAELTPFLVAGLVSVLVAGGVLSILGLLVAPTVEKVLPGTGSLVKAVSFSLALVIVIGSVLFGVSALTGARCLPFAVKGIRRAACALFTGARTIAKAHGGCESAVGRSFLAAQNNLVRAWRGNATSDHVLVLLPHCLEPGVRADVQAIIERYSCRARIVGGGSEALEAIDDEKPDALVAVACERDLVAGVTDLGGRVPWVLAVPIMQPHGPCKRTELNVPAFEDALALLAAKRVDGTEACSVPHASLLPETGGGMISSLVRRDD